MQYQSTHVDWPTNGSRIHVVHRRINRLALRNMAATEDNCWDDKLATVVHMSVFMWPCTLDFRSISSATQTHLGQFEDRDYACDLRCPGKDRMTQVRLPNFDHTYAH